MIKVGMIQGDINRKQRGKDISAACGMLSTMKSKKMIFCDCLSKFDDAVAALRLGKFATTVTKRRFLTLWQSMNTGS